MSESIDDRLGLTTSAVDALVILFEALAPDERGLAIERLNERWVRHQAGDDSEAARLLKSLIKVRDYVGKGNDLSYDDYREAKLELDRLGEGVAPLSQILKHFKSWRMAKEALTLAEVTTARKIEARFSARRLGKVWRYREETMGDTLAQCVAAIGHVPQVAEFEWWRQREIELARSKGDDAFHLPSSGPYRSRWKTWAGALKHFGYSDDEIAARAEQ
jgi:hypothetical protein